LNALQDAAAQSISQCAERAIAERGRFRIVLAGGNTPRAIYEKLRNAKTDWASWEIYFGDERCLPPEHPERNSLMANEAWLGHVPIPQNQIHAIAAELGPIEGARRYSEILNRVDDFDLVLLGLGEDGHTASLFPEKDWDEQDAFAVFDSPKPPPERVTLSPARLSASRSVYFLVSGESKRQAVSNWRSGIPIPATFISPVSGVDIYIESHLLG
jgi:6-phosphogluconolactonase